MFDALSPKNSPLAWHRFGTNTAIIADIDTIISGGELAHFAQRWHDCRHSTDDQTSAWLITLFDRMYGTGSASGIPTMLVRGDGEPEYFSAKDGLPARIEFAHGFLQSALHEISHWCVAGKRRRTLDDFGYWYMPDGRDLATQRLFEQVEIIPQAIECLLSLALGRRFCVSADNLNATFDPHDSTFAQDVFAKADEFLHHPCNLPTDAKRLLWVFWHINH